MFKARHSVFRYVEAKTSVFACKSNNIQKSFVFVGLLFINEKRKFDYFFIQFPFTTEIAIFVFSNEL